MIPLQKVQEIINKYNILEKELSSGKVEPKQFAKKSKEYSNLGNIILVAKEYLNFDNERKGLEQIIKDKTNDTEMIEMAKNDLNLIDNKKIKYENKLKIFLLPKDEDDSKNAIVEIRAGTGGLEASLFCADLFKMYEKVCSKKNWKVEIISNTAGHNLPLKVDATFEIKIGSSPTIAGSLFSSTDITILIFLLLYCF